jgi:hypothetical protein
VVRIAPDHFALRRQASTGRSRIKMASFRALDGCDGIRKRLNSAGIALPSAHPRFRTRRRNTRHVCTPRGMKGMTESRWMGQKSRAESHSTGDWGRNYRSVIFSFVERDCRSQPGIGLQHLQVLRSVAGRIVTVTLPHDMGFSQRQVKDMTRRVS